jgi:hypothetical protein
MLDDVGNSSAHRSWRSAAAELLGRLSSRVSGVSPRLGERLGAPDRWLRLFATLALRCFRSPDRNLVRLAEKVARDEWPRIRLATVRAVARAHSESGDVTRLLDTFADDDDPMVRGDAVWALRMRSEQNRS